MKYKWPLIIICFLLGHMLLMIVAISIATSDRSFAVVPNYYREAVNWDQAKSLQQASDQLKWKVTLDISPSSSPQSDRAVTLDIVDATGKQVEVSNVELKYFHYSHGAEAISVDLTPRDHRNTGTIRLPYVGFHEFHILVNAGEKQFVRTITQYVPAGVQE